MMSIDNKGYVPLVSRICRSLPTLFARSVHITPLPHEDQNTRKEKLLISMLHRVFLIGRTTWTTAAQWESAGFMAMSFAKNRKRNGELSLAPEDAALVDTYSMVRFCLHELMKCNRKPQKAVEIIALMLQRLLANNNNARMQSNFQFGSGLDDDLEKKVVAAMPIMILMFELILEYDGKSKAVSDCARDILRSIGGRMQTDGIVFDAELCEFLKNGSFNSASWWIKYSIHSWYSKSLNYPKRQVPAGVYQVLSEDNKDFFEQIKAEEVSNVSECFFKSLFELGLYDVDLAIELLHVVHTANFAKSDIVETMTLAFVDAYGKRMAKSGGGLEVEKLIKELLKIVDPIRDLVPLKTYNTGFLDATKNIEHILVLFKAARIAREKKICASRSRTNETRQASQDELLSLDEVSEQLMDIYCESAKAHIDKQVS